MYKVIGADGKEYGPVSLEQLSEWAAKGRVNTRTQVQATGSAQWIPASDIPELQAVFAKLRGSPPPPLPVGGGAAQPQQKGMAITSLVLGIVSLFCLGPLAGIPAIICGHMAQNRARRSPAQYGGSGMAIAGLAMGYASFIVGIAFLSAMLLPALARAKDRAQRINCTNNMKMIGLAFKTWAISNNDQFPFNVSTNKGGTLELCQPGPDGFDQNTAAHLQALSAELGTPKVLVCPADTKQPALNWMTLHPTNVSYQVCSGESVNDTNPQGALAVCPIHNNVLRSDGSVQQMPRSRARGR